jgi:signal transduction histidine kinase
MADQSPRIVLNESSDPILLINGSGDILWQNDSAENLLDLTIEPGKSSNRDGQQAEDSESLPNASANINFYFSFPIVQQILSTKQFNLIELELDTKNLGIISQTAIVIETSSGSPDSEVFLLILKSFLVNCEQYRETYREELSAIVHDLKNPLGAVFGYADALLETQTGENLTNQQKDILKRICATISRTIDLIKNYQQLFNIRSGRIRSARKYNDLNLTVQNVLEGIWHSNEDHPSLNLDLSTETVEVPVELIQLDRIVSNLFSNAVKYTPTSETITLKTWKTGNESILQINNTGSVIPDHELSSIFDKYARASTGKETTGSGLGLFIVKSILDAIGGSILVESTQKSGTTFTVYFPGRQ